MKSSLRRSFVLGSLAALVATVLTEGGRADQEGPKGEVRYNRDVRPILSNHCFKCHGPDQKKGGLDLQSREAALKDNKSGQPAIVPGKSAESELIRRVLGEGDGPRMPPKGKSELLTKAQVATLRAWIDQGAKYEEHWAYVKPATPPLPAVKNKAWPRNAIDHFVLARLEREGLQPSPEAGPLTLLRRASLDLTGLPPTVAEIDAFLADNEPNAYERAVERLLASVHYGERQAHPWLDQARYADTNGYEADARRSMYPYRDWVIAALNKDMPFDQFTIEQIAGDLLPNATLEQKVATGYHRNTMVNTEGGTDDEEFRAAAVIDRVNTTMQTWMGSTIACAQCHNHKYDPFSQKEYFQLYAFFNNTEDRGRGNAPEMPVLTAEQLAFKQKLADDMARAQAILDTPTPALIEAQAKWEATAGQGKPAWTVLEPIALSAAGKATLTGQKDNSVLASGTLAATESYRVEAATLLKGITGFRLEVLTDPTLPGQGPGRAPNGNFVLSEMKITAAPSDDAKMAKPVTLQNATADHSQQDWPIAAAIDGTPETGWAVATADGKTGQNRTALFETKDDLGFDKGTRFVITLDQNYGSQHLIGRFRLAVTNTPRPLRQNSLPDAVAKTFALPAEQRTPAQRDEVAKFYRTIAPELQPTRERLAALRKQDSEFKPATTLVMKEMPKPRESFIHVRGNHASKGETVTAGVPGKLHGLKSEGRANRLALARWLVDADNPLVGRVTMNRLWAQYFGRGLVETSEDFGIQGDLPTHPELLDWLATEFARQKWSLKAMHRNIVTSATYRQSSKVSRELYQRDQYNLLYARGPRFRMDAEMVRDNALAVSGLLTRKVGGPSVFPYQPDGVWFNPYSGDRWATSTNGEQYRRGLYTFWRRTAPYAAFMAFDAPSREVACERRPRTNTPLQALATLNDKAFVEPAQALARRMMSEVKASEKERAIHGFRLCVARGPNDVELAALIKLYNVSLEKYKKDAASAKALAVGTLPEPPKDMDLAELAAWTVVANVLLNLDETITKG